MQTIYYTTPNFISHRDNVVDLAEYRRKLALTQEGSLAPQPRTEELASSAEASLERPLLREVRPSRSRRYQRRAMALDICASLGVVLMTLTFTLRVLMA